MEPAWFRPGRLFVSKRHRCAAGCGSKRGLNGDRVREEVEPCDLARGHTSRSATSHEAGDAMSETHESFAFVDAGRTFTCCVETMRRASPEPWWWFRVSTEEHQRYAPFRAEAND